MAVHGRSRMRYPVCSQTSAWRAVTAGTFLPAGTRDTDNRNHPFRHGSTVRTSRLRQASSRDPSQSPAPRPNLAFRRLRGQRSPAEFAAAVRRAAREIGEQVCCDARYIGRVEAGEIRCPNYAYERVFLHMFPGRTLTDLGFAPRASVRGRRARAAEDAPLRAAAVPACSRASRGPSRTTRTTGTGPVRHAPYTTLRGERRAASRIHDRRGATVAAASLGPSRSPSTPRPGRPVRRVGGARRRRRGGRPPDPAARRPARRGRPLPARRGPAARRLRAARRGRPRQSDRRPAPLGRRGTGHLGGLAGP